MPGGNFIVFSNAAMAKAIAASSSAAVDTNASGAVQKSTYNANTILAAPTNDTPIPVEISASSFVGRTASGSIESLWPSQARVLMGVPQITSSYTVLAAGADRVTNTADPTQFTNVVVIPANVAVGSKINFEFAGVIADGSDVGNTLAFTFKVGATTVFATMAADPATNNTFVFSGWLTVSATGGGGLVSAFVSAQTSFNVNGGIAFGQIAVTSLDLSQNQNISLTADWLSATTTSQVDLRMMSMERKILGTIT